MSGSEASEEETGQSVGVTDWRFYSQKEKDDRRGEVSAWLEQNYVATKGVWLLSELVYKHYREYCSQKFLDTATEKTFTRMMIRTFPNVEFCHVGAKRGQKSCYYQGLDIRKTSLEYDSIIKGRKTNLGQTKSTSIKRKSSNNNASQEESTKKLKTDSKDSADVSRCTECVANWKDCTSDYKENHRKSTIEWLENEYEVAPQICVLRTDVYQHYLDYCDKHKLAAAPQTIFGRIIQKAFSKMTMRRLGGRGDSKYYYMGIDVKPASDHYDTVSNGRMVSVDSKPKKNSFSNFR